MSSRIETHHGKHMTTTVIPVTVYGDTIITERELDERLPADRSPIGVHGTTEQCGGLIRMARISAMYTVIECDACNLRVAYPVRKSQTIRALIGQARNRNYRKTGSSGIARDKHQPDE